jgi:hypothetical protein
MTAERSFNLRAILCLLASNNCLLHSSSSVCNRNSNSRAVYLMHLPTSPEAAGDS